MIRAPQATSLRELLHHLHLKEIPCLKDLNIHSILVKPLGQGVITHCTPTLSLKVAVLYQEVISFLVLEDSIADMDAVDANPLTSGQLVNGTNLIL